MERVFHLGWEELCTKWKLQGREGREDQDAETSSEVSDLQKAVAAANVTGIAFVAESYPSSV